MKSWFAVVGFVSALPMTSAAAGEANVSGARVTQILTHGSYYNTQSFVVFFDKTAGGCDGMWVDTKTLQANRTFELLLTAFANQIRLDYSMDSNSRWPGSSMKICEMRYVWLKR